MASRRFRKAAQISGARPERRHSACKVVGRPVINVARRMWCALVSSRWGMLSISRQTTNVLLQGLQARGLIRVQRGEIEILQWQALCAERF